MACFMMLCCVDEVESILSRCLTKVYKRLEQHFRCYRFCYVCLERDLMGMSIITVMTQTADSDNTNS